LDKEIEEAIAKFAEHPVTDKEQSSVSKCLSAKKAAGIPINAQAVDICISESRKKGNKSKMSDDDFFHLIPITYQIVDLK